MILLTFFVLAAIQLFGNLPALDFMIRTPDPDQNAPAWRFGATLAAGDMHALVTQCLVLIGTLTIAIVASPIASRLRGGGPDSVTFASIVEYRWNKTLSLIAVGVASVGNAVALCSLLLLLSDPSCTACSAGLPPVLLLLAFVGSALAAVAMRPTGDQLVGSALMDAELARTNEQITRLKDALPTPPPTRRWRWGSSIVIAIWLLLTPLLSLLIGVLAVSGITGEPIWRFRWEAAIPAAVVILLLQLVLIFGPSTVGTAYLIYWRWRVVGAAGKARTISMLRLAPLSPLVVAGSVYLWFVLDYQPAADDPSLLQTRLTAAAVFFTPGLVAAFFAFTWIEAIGWAYLREREAWAESLERRQSELFPQEQTRGQLPPTPPPINDNSAVIWTSIAAVGLASGVAAWLSHQKRRPTQ